MSKVWTFFLFSSYSCQLLLFQDNTILIGFCLQNCSLSPHRCPQTGLLPRRRGAGTLGRKAWRLLGEKVKEMLLLPLSPCPLLLLFILCYFSCLVQNHNYKKQKHLFFFLRAAHPPSHHWQRELQGTRIWRAQVPPRASVLHSPSGGPCSEGGAHWRGPRGKPVAMRTPAWLHMQAGSLDICLTVTQGRKYGTR